MKVRKPVIPAAGLGTRFLPVTKAQPKEMLPVHNKPAIQYVVEEARQAGIDDMMIITGRNKETMARHFNHTPDLYDQLKKDKKTHLLEELKTIEHIGEELYQAQQGEPKGLAHAISRAEAYVANEPFAVLLGDDLVTTKHPFIKTLMDLYEEYGRSTVTVASVPEEKVSSYYTVGDPVSQMITSIEFASKDPKLWPEIEKYLKEKIGKSNQIEDDLLQIYHALLPYLEFS